MKELIADRWERISAMAGLAAVSLWLVGVILVEVVAGEAPVAADELLAYYTQHDTVIIIGSFLFMLGSVFFLWFAGILRAVLQRAEGDVGTFTNIAFAGGIGLAVLSLGVFSGMTIAFEPAEFGAQGALAVDSVGDIFFVGAGLSAIALLCGTAVVALRTAVLPKWWAAFGLLIALVIAIGPILWLGVIFGLPVWTLGTSLMLALNGRAKKETADAPLAAQPAA